MSMDNEKLAIKLENSAETFFNDYRGNEYKNTGLSFVK